MDPIQSLRKELDRLLAGKGAHADFDAAIADFPPNLRGVKPQGAAGGDSHSAWELLEHLRIAQWDMLEFSRDAKHVSPDWPAGYWPENPEPDSAAAWDRSVKAFHRDLAAMRKLVSRPEVGSLYADCAWRWADASTRGAADGRPQRLPRGRIDLPPPPFGGLEMSARAQLTC